MSLLGEIKKNRISKLIGLTAFGAVLILNLTGCANSEAGVRSTAEEYITLHYGSNYRIVDYRSRENSDSGMKPARVTVRQNGFDYILRIENGQVVEDTYSSAYAGRIAMDAVRSRLEADNPNLDLSKRNIDYSCDFIVTDPNLLQLDLDFTSAKDYADVMNIVSSNGGIGSAYITIQIHDSGDYKKEEWLYDYYLACQDELDRYQLLINFTNANGNITDHTSLGCAPYEKEPTITRDEFLKKFQ